MALKEVEEHFEKMARREKSTVDREADQLENDPYSSNFPFTGMSADHVTHMVSEWKKFYADNAVISNNERFMLFYRDLHPLVLLTDERKYNSVRKTTMEMVMQVYGLSNRRIKLAVGATYDEVVSFHPDVAEYLASYHNLGLPANQLVSVRPSIAHFVRKFINNKPDDVQAVANQLRMQPRSIETPARAVELRSMTKAAERLALDEEAEEYVAVGDENENVEKESSSDSGSDEDAPKRKKQKKTTESVDLTQAEDESHALQRKNTEVMRALQPSAASSSGGSRTYVPPGAITSPKVQEEASGKKSKDAPKRKKGEDSGPKPKAAKKESGKRGKEDKDEVEDKAEGAAAEPILEIDNSLHAYLTAVKKGNDIYPRIKF